MKIFSKHLVPGRWGPRRRGFARPESAALAGFGFHRATAMDASSSCPGKVPEGFIPGQVSETAEVAAVGPWFQVLCRSRITSPRGTAVEGFPVIRPRPKRRQSPSGPGTPGRRGNIHPKHWRFSRRQGRGVFIASGGGVDLPGRFFPPGPQMGAGAGKLQIGCAILPKGTCRYGLSFIMGFSYVFLSKGREQCRFKFLHRTNSFFFFAQFPRGGSRWFFFPSSFGAACFVFSRLRVSRFFSSRKAASSGHGVRKPFRPPAYVTRPPLVGG